MEWTDECKESFRKPEELCISTPILASADYSRPFKLHADTCGLGLGAVLYQRQDDGTDRIIAYTSRAVSKSQRNYPIH